VAAVNIGLVPVAVSVGAGVVIMFAAKALLSSGSSATPQQQQEEQLALEATEVPPLAEDVANNINIALFGNTNEGKTSLSRIIGRHKKGEVGLEGGLTKVITPYLLADSPLNIGVNPGGVMLFDTPGFRGAGERGRELENLTWDSITPNIDVAVVVGTGACPLTTFIEDFRQAKQKLAISTASSVVVVVNKIFTAAVDVSALGDIRDQWLKVIRQHEPAFPAENLFLVEAHAESPPAKMRPAIRAAQKQFYDEALAAKAVNRIANPNPDDDKTDTQNLRCFIIQKAIENAKKMN